MTRGAIISHLCWAAVALLAFGAGANRQRASSDDASAESPKSGRRAALAAGGVMAAEGRAPKSRVPRGADDGMVGPVAEMFPLPGIPRSEAELEALALEAMRDGNPVTRRMAFTRLLESLTPENAAMLRGHLLEFKADEAQWRDFHYAWGSIDGNAAVRQAMESKEYDMRFTMSGWASANPNEAGRFLETLPGDIKTDRELLKRGLVEGLADRDPDLATDLVYGLEAKGDKSASSLIGSVTSEVLQAMGREGAATWSESLPDGALKGAAMDRVAHALVEKDPKLAAEWAGKFASEPYAGRVIEEVGDEWAKRDPVKAVDWLETLDNGSGQRSGLESAYLRWSYRDPAAAGERLATMPRSPERDAAINGFVRGFAGKDPVGAIDWANSIANQTVRNRALTQAGQALFRRDPQAAREWLPASGLPASAQQAVMKPSSR